MHAALLLPPATSPPAGALWRRKPCCPRRSAGLTSAGFPAEEPRRYAALVRHLEAQWAADKAQHGVNAAAEATLPYVPLAKWCDVVPIPLAQLLAPGCLGLVAA
jgi:hypothetical protein